MSGNLASRLNRAVEQAGLKPRQIFSTITSIDVRARREAPGECRLPACHAHFRGEVDRRGVVECWMVTAEDEERLASALDDLIAAGRVPAGDWTRSQSAPCDGGESCTHLPKVIQ